MRERQERGPASDGGVACAEQGVVLLDGPGGVAIAMTVEAAERTAHSLLAAAETAARQRSPTDPRR